MEGDCEFGQGKSGVFTPEAKVMEIKTIKDSKNELKKEFERDYQQLLSEIKRKVSASDELGSSSNRSKVVSHFEDIRSRVQDLQKLLSDASPFLTTYEKRVANQTSTGIQEMVSYKEEELLPKRKFSFKTRIKKTLGKAEDELPEAVSENAVTALDDHMFVSISDASGQVIERGTEVVDRKDVELSRLRDCTVRIFGSPGTLHLTALTGCRIFVGPVTTSVFMEECHACVVSVACQQLRVHASRDITFHLHITSRSIVEECSDIRFAKYNWNYEGLEQHFASSGLDRKVNNWRLVDDFNWLANKQSPNWSLLPEEAETDVEINS